MDIEKMRKWLEITNEYKKSDFWTSVLEQKYPDQPCPEKREEGKRRNWISIKMRTIIILFLKYRA